MKTPLTKKVRPEHTWRNKPKVINLKRCEKGCGIILKYAKDHDCSRILMIPEEYGHSR